ncbi:glycoside hydrolase family 30 beta sandwich domain-containing protein [Sorangium sp. So ce260]|uniref:glycoside hydrolase family 30 beta sandwich domain-containing protein n=1 Tax=Sorangium sp. So ce260 TaxID=3133291 RepID=UPI003F5DF355
MFLGSVTMATSFIRPLQAGHSRTSIANVRRKSSARFVDRPIAATRVAIARWVHSALVVGEANAWLWWWYSGNTTNEGLIQQSGSVTTKRYYTFGNFTRYIRPAYHRVAVTGVFPEKVLVSAYTNDSGKVVVVAINETTSALTVPLAFAGGTAPSAMVPFVTAASKNWAEGTPVTVTDATLPMALEAMSVTTFVSQ